ncbi:hypothetical protein ACF2JD_17680 [Aeromonas sp. A-5]
MLQRMDSDSNPENGITLDKMHIAQLGNTIVLKAMTLSTPA